MQSQNNYNQFVQQNSNINNQQDNLQPLIVNDINNDQSQKQPLLYQDQQQQEYFPPQQNFFNSISLEESQQSQSQDYQPPVIEGLQQIQHEETLKLPQQQQWGKQNQNQNPSEQQKGYIQQKSQQQDQYFQQYKQQQSIQQNQNVQQQFEPQNQQIIQHQPQQPQQPQYPQQIQQQAWQSIFHPQQPQQPLFHPQQPQQPQYQYQQQSQPQQQQSQQQNIFVECKFCQQGLQIPNNINKFKCSKCQKINVISNQDMQLLKSMYQPKVQQQIKKVEEQKEQESKAKEYCVECSYCRGFLQIPLDMKEFRCPKCQKVNKIDQEDQKLVQSLFQGKEEPKEIPIECQYCHKFLQIPLGTQKFQCPSCQKIGEISKEDDLLLKSVYGLAPKQSIKPKVEVKKQEEPKLCPVECKWCRAFLEIPLGTQKFQCSHCKKTNEIAQEDMNLLKSVYGLAPKPISKAKSQSNDIEIVKCQFCQVSLKIPRNCKQFQCGVCKNLNCIDYKAQPSQPKQKHNTFVCGWCNQSVRYEIGKSDFIRCSCGKVNFISNTGKYKDYAEYKRLSQLKKKHEKKSKVKRFFSKIFSKKTAKWKNIPDDVVINPKQIQDAVQEQQQKQQEKPYEGKVYQIPNNQLPEVSVYQPQTIAPIVQNNLQVYYPSQFQRVQQQQTNQLPLPVIQEQPQMKQNVEKVQTYNQVQEAQNIQYQNQLQNQQYQPRQYTQPTHLQQQSSQPYVSQVQAQNQQMNKQQQNQQQSYDSFFQKSLYQPVQNVQKIPEFYQQEIPQEKVPQQLIAQPVIQSYNQQAQVQVQKQQAPQQQIRQQNVQQQQEIYQYQPYKPQPQVQVQQQKVEPVVIAKRKPKKKVKKSKKIRKQGPKIQQAQQPQQASQQDMQKQLNMMMQMQMSMIQSKDQGNLNPELTQQSSFMMSQMQQMMSIINQQQKQLQQQQISIQHKQEDKEIKQQELLDVQASPIQNQILPVEISNKQSTLLDFEAKQQLKIDDMEEIESIIIPNNKKMEKYGAQKILVDLDEGESLEESEEESEEESAEQQQQQALLLN